jgi:apolipoprotein N-acyltransferase
MIPLVFVAWVPLLAVQDSIVTTGKGRAMWYAFTAFLIWNLLCTYFLFAVSEPLSTRLFSYLAPAIANALLMALPFSLATFVRRRSGRRLGTFALVLSWIAFEYLHQDWDLSWTWLTLGNIFSGMISWVQWYEYTGVLGGTLWILIINLLVYELVRVYPTFEKRQYNATIAVIMLVAVPTSWSLWRYNTYTAKGDPYEVVIVQPNIDPYNEKFSASDPLHHLNLMLEQAESAMTEETALVMFPETAVQERATLSGSSGNLILNGLWENHWDGSISVPRLRRFLEKHPTTTLLIGMSSERLLEEGEALTPSARKVIGTDRYYESYNTAFGLHHGGKPVVYHKSKLVPGVEKLPFEGLFGSLKILSVDLGGTTGSLGVQDERVVLPAVGGELRAAPVICYESVYGEFVGEYLNEGANLIAIITNDGWWSDAPGYKHHLAYARLRAVETRKDVARCANTGISCFINQRGDITFRSEWWVEAVLRGQVMIHDELTFYTKYGDQIGRVSVLLAILLILHAFSRGFIKRS